MTDPSANGDFPVWCDGRIALDADRLLELAPHPRCITTGRIVAGRVRFAEYHERRLRRDAAQQGLGALPAGLCVRALEELGQAIFGKATGIVRVEAARGKDDGLHVIARARVLGAEPRIWTALRASFDHEGPTASAGAKLADRPLYERGRADAKAAGVDEALLFDPVGRLVEGCRTNIFFVAADGSLCTPPLERGAVRGIARDVALARIHEIQERDLGREEILHCAELIAVNAVRGATPIGTLDGARIGSGTAGPGTNKLVRALNANE